jgi:hypothetical protein
VLFGKATLLPFPAPGVPNGMLRMLRLMLPFSLQATSVSQRSMVPLALLLLLLSVSSSLFLLRAC